MYVMMMIIVYSVTTTLVSAFTQVKEKGTSLLLIVPGLCISPLLMVSACIPCSPPYLLTLLGFLPSGVWHAVLLSTTCPLAPVCVPRPGAG